MTWKTWLQDRGAHFTERGIEHFGDWPGEIDAATSSLVIADLGHRDHLRMSGADVFPFLDRLLTYAMKSVSIGDGCRPFLLNARGRIEGSFYAYRPNETELWVDTAAEHGVALAQRLDMFHFGEDFHIESAGLTYRHFALVGPQVPSFLTSVGLPTPDSEWSYIRSNEDEVHVGRIPRFGPTSVDLWVSDDVARAWWERFVSAGAKPTGRMTLNAVRIQSGVPAHPYEFSDAVTPLDSGGMNGITDGKGCYPGQEVIERTIALGRPSRVLKRFEASGAVAAEDAIYAGERKVGRVTSALRWPDGSYSGLALVKGAAAEQVSWTTESGMTLQVHEQSGQP